jgi:hypothetical protein
MPMSRMATSGRSTSACGQRLLAVGRGVHLVPFHLQQRGHGLSASALSSATSTAGPAPRVACRRRLRLRGSAWRPPLRQPHRELRARPGPVAGAPRCVPPCSCTRPRLSARPMPSPPSRDRSSAADTCENIVKISRAGAGDRPMPLSRTRSTTSPARAPPSTSMRPPGSVYLAAFDSRLDSTCARRTGSTRTGTGCAAASRRACGASCGRPAAARFPARRPPPAAARPAPAAVPACRARCARCPAGRRAAAPCGRPAGR